MLSASTATPSASTSLLMDLVQTGFTSRSRQPWFLLHRLRAQCRFDVRRRHQLPSADECRQDQLLMLSSSATKMTSPWLTTAPTTARASRSSLLRRRLWLLPPNVRCATMKWSRSAPTLTARPSLASGAGEESLAVRFAEQTSF